MRIYSTRRRGSVVGLGTPVADLAALRKLSTTGIIDKTIVYVEDEGAIYAYDRQSSAGESVPLIIAPNTGGGRWLLVSGGGGGVVADLHVHNKYADVSAVVGPNQVVISHEEFEIEDGVTVELLDNSDLLIL